MRLSLKLVTGLAAMLQLLLWVQPASATVVAIDLSSYGGETSFDGWLNGNLTLPSNPGFPGFPGTTAWPNPIGSGAPDSGDANLVKVANGLGGGPYPASGSIYYGGFSSTVNYNGGTLAVEDTNPVANLNTVIFQIEIGEAWTYDFLNHALPVLSYNGGTQSLAATCWTVVDKDFNGTVTMPTGEENLYNNTYALQWDLSGITEAISSFRITFTGVQHAQLYALQLDQSSAEIGVFAVPEPSRAVLGMIALGACLFRRNRGINNGTSQLA